MLSSGSLPTPITWLLLVLVLAAALYDLRFRRIPNWLAATGILLGLLTNVFVRGAWPGLGFSLTGLGVALSIYFALYALRAMGAGDVKLMAALGAMIGWKDWIGLFLITTILGGIAAVIVSIGRRRLKKTLWNVGFALSQMTRGRPAYLSNEELDVRSPKALRLPHGAVIAAGTLTYLALVARPGG